MPFQCQSLNEKVTLDYFLSVILHLSIYQDVLYAVYHKDAAYLKAIGHLVHTAIGRYVN